MTAIDARLDALIKAWAIRELEALPRGQAGDWLREGAPPPELAALLARLPEAVRALVCEHVADGIDVCECCRARAPLRLLSDRSESGERDWRCAWGCPPPEEEQPGDEAMREWAEEAGL